MASYSLFSLMVLVTTALIQSTTASYFLVDNYTGEALFSEFTFFTGSDPTHGFVEYVSEPRARQAGLISSGNEHAYIGVDFHNTVTTGGRPSVRLASKNTYNKGLLLADLTHMPGGLCGVWPALWLLGAGAWPANGEIDVVEGVNAQTENLMTLHSTAGCGVDNSTAAHGGAAATVSRNGSYSGRLATPDCDVDALGQGRNVGCQIAAPAAAAAPPAPAAATFGTAFNANGAGVFAMEWTRAGVGVWFFARPAPHAGLPPGVATADQRDPDPSPDFGEPLARFAGAGCDFDGHFRDMTLVLNTAFCGDWAGAEGEWVASGCRERTGFQTCRDYVAGRPAEFEEAYWNVSGLRWYEKAACGMVPVEGGCLRRECMISRCGLAGRDGAGRPVAVRSEGVRSASSLISDGEE